MKTSKHNAGNSLTTTGKTLLLVRHAKSSWSAPELSDFDRPLNDRGKTDAPEMARRLKQKKIEVDLLVSSPAKRAKKTAKYFAEAFEMDKEAILLISDLYLATQAAFEAVVATLPNEAATAAIFSHNPGITAFANSLTRVQVDDMPTCSVFAVTADAQHWSGFLAAEKQFLFFDYPKNPMA